MILCQSLLVVVIGLCSGMVIAGGIIAFLSLVELIPRIACRLRSASWSYGIETSVFAGALLGCIASLYEINIPLGYLSLSVFGLFAGIFVGCLAMAVAEVFKVFPIFVKRVKMRYGLPYIVFAMALGKAVGTFWQLFFRFS